MKVRINVHDQLMRYANRTLPAPINDWSVARQARKLYDETRLAVLKADGVMALAGHVMDGQTLLDLHRRALAATGGEATSLMLTEIHLTAIRRCLDIQRGLFRGGAE